MAENKIFLFSAINKYYPYWKELQIKIIIQRHLKFLHYYQNHLQ